MDGAEDGVGTRAGKILYPLFVGQVFSVVVTALTFIVVARLLQPRGYGIYTFAFGFSTLINAFMAFGVGIYFSSSLSKLVYKRDGEGLLRTLSSGFIIACTVGVILTLFGIAISGYVSGVYSSTVGVSPLELMIAAGTIIAGILNTLGTSALIGFSRSGLSSILSVAVDVIQLILSVVMTIWFGVAGAIAAMLIGYVFGAVIGLYFIFVAVSKYVKFRIYIPTRRELGQVFSVVWPLAATNFLNTSMQSFSILFLGFYVSTAVLGNYGAASKGLTLLALVYGTLGSGLMPIFTAARAMRVSEEINSTYNKIIHFALVSMLPIIMYVGVMAVPGLYLLVGGNYTTAPIYLTLIAIGSTVGLFGTYVSYLLISGDHTRSVMRVNFISAVAQLVLMVVLVPYLKVIGAIITIFFVGNVIEAIFFARDAKMLFGIKFEFRKMLMLYLGTLAFGVILAGFYFASNAALPIQSLSARYIVELIIAVLFSVLVYPVVLIALRAVNGEDLTDMRHATMKLGRVSGLFNLFFNYSAHVYRFFTKVAPHGLQ